MSDSGQPSAEEASAAELSAFAALLHSDLIPTALPPERQQELMLKGIIAALEESAAQEVPAAREVAGGQEVREARLTETGLLREAAAAHPLESVRTQALQALLRLAHAGRVPAVDALYRLAVEDNLLGARQAILTRGLQPGRPALRALFDWFTSLESNSPYPEEKLAGLTQSYFEEASPALQRRLLATAAQNRAENWARLMEALQKGDGTSLLELVDRYPTFRPVERGLALDQLDRLARQGAPTAQEAARMALSLLFIRHEDPRARQFILTHQYFPEEPEQRALFFFLAEDWQRYEALDFDHSLLASTYETAGRSLRRRLLEHSRHTGQMDWLREIGSSGEVRWLNDLTDADWDLSIRRLTESEKWGDLWRLAQVAPPVWSAQILDRLAKRGWAPEAAPGSEEERVEFQKLAALARESLANPLSVRPQKAMYAPPISDITCLAIQPDGETLTAGGSDQYIRRWKLPDGIPLDPVIGPAQVSRTLAFSPDSQLLATASGDNRIRAFRLPNGQLLKVFEGHQAMIRALAIHPDGRTLYSAGFDGTIRSWRFPYGSEPKTIHRGPGEIFGMVLGANGSHLISAGTDCLVRVWTLPEGTLAREMTGHTETITHLASSPGSELVASAGREGVIRVWNFTSGGLVRLLESGAGPLTALCLHPNEQVLIGGRSSGEITLWSLSTGRVIDAFSVHRKPITGLVLSPSGETLYSADSIGHIHAWDLSLFLTIRLPGEISRPGTAAGLLERLKGPNLSPSEKKWLEFSAELARWRQRFDIELAEPGAIQVGEFDIEL